MQCMNSGSHCSAIRGVEWVYRVDQAVLRRTPLATGAMATIPKKQKQNIANQLYM